MSHGEPADLTLMNSLGVDSQKDLLSDLCDVTDFRCFVLSIFSAVDMTIPRQADYSAETQRNHVRIEINPPPSTKEVGVRCEVGIGMSEVFFLQSTGRKSCLLQRFNNTKSTKIQSLWPAITSL